MPRHHRTDIETLRRISVWHGDAFGLSFSKSVETRGIMDRLGWVLGCLRGGQRLGWCVGGCDLRSDIMTLTTIAVLTLFCRFPGTLRPLEEGNAGSGVSGRTCLGRVKEDGNMVTLRDGG
jgi:hypothetical protein